MADFLIVMAVTDPEGRPHQRASMFIVPVDTPGVEILRDVGTMEHPDPGFGNLGGHAEIRYEGVRVPGDALLGPRGAGFLIAQQRLGPGRIHHCMRWLGQARRAFDMLCERSLYRETHGSVLAEKQTIQNWIADSAAEMQAARLMTLHAAWVMDTEGQAAARKEISLIKFFGAKVLHDVIDRALQAHGSLGYSTDMPLEGMYRWARGARFYDGPDEVHRQSVARLILRGYEPPGRRRSHRARAHPHGRGARQVRAPARDRHRERLGRRAMSVRVLVVALVLQLVLAAALIFVVVNGFSIPGVDDAVKDAQRAPVATAHRFDGSRAMRDVRSQVALGPRPAGSPALKRLARRLRAELPNGRFEPVPGGPDQRRRLAARPQAGDPARRALRHEGPARLRRRQRRRRRRRRGARGRAGAARPSAPAAARPRSTSPSSTGRSPRAAPRTRTSWPRACAAPRPTRRAAPDASTRAMILADFVGQRGLRIEREANSDRPLWNRLRRAARKVGAGAVFPGGTAEGIFDDHIPYAAPRDPRDRPDRFRLSVLPPRLRPARQARRRARSTRRGRRSWNSCKAGGNGLVTARSHAVFNPRAGPGHDAGHAQDTLTQAARGARLSGRPRLRGVLAPLGLAADLLRCWPETYRP